jgi:transposase
MTRRLERDLLAAGERIVRVPPKLMAHARDAARTYGKSDPIDALAVARAAPREDALPTAHLAGPDRELRLLVDHREDLIAERTRATNPLRWHLHELDLEWDPPARSLDRVRRDGHPRPTAPSWVRYRQRDPHHATAPKAGVQAGIPSTRGLFTVPTSAPTKPFVGF